MPDRSQAIKPQRCEAGAQSSWDLCLSRNTFDMFNNSSQRERCDRKPGRQAGKSHHTSRHCRPQDVKERKNCRGALSRTMRTFNWV